MDSGDELMFDFVVFTADEILFKGLQLLGWDEKRLGRRQPDTNKEQYAGMYGASPVVTAQLFEDLQTTDVVDAKIEPSEISIDRLHWCMHWLYRYPTETERESTWQKCANTIRDAAWFYVSRIRALKVEKIVWPKFKETDVWVMTVDGTHLVTMEPGDSDIPKDPSYFSFKHHTAGFNYEVGVDLFQSRCIWLKGPYKAGKYVDAKIFREKGLMAKLGKEGKKAIGDEGYRGFPDEISTRNSLDSQEVKEFKTRARQRHEIYNSFLKHFDILSERFRCKQNPKDKFTVDQKLQMVFEAVNVLVQYKMEAGDVWLFDI